MTNRASAPLFATVNVTGRCNLQCRYCFFQPRSAAVMEWPDFRNTVDQLREQSVFFINISGGEPFTHPQIGRFLHYANESFHHVVVLTNGTTFRPAHFAVIESIVRRKGSFPVQVSLDSSDPAINAQTRSGGASVRANLARLRDIGANIVIAMVISRFNVNDLLRSISELSAYSRFFHIMPLQFVPALHGSDCDWAIAPAELVDVWERIRSLREQLHLDIDTPLDCVADVGCATGAPCMAAFSQIVIDPDLMVRPCDRLVSTFIGDLRKNSLAEIWSGEPALQIVTRTRPACALPMPLPAGSQSSPRVSSAN